MHNDDIIILLETYMLLKRTKDRIMMTMVVSIPMTVAEPMMT